ncbi:MAG TPA: aldo/keto reductase [Candidatus Cybelea sp.]|jgi:diketogulonate reductase-like aldo/keto reductase|nr:aldo/keto reductase [Candidatus Cybelea sp.]
MKYKAFGKTGVELPVIGQGTWNLPERGAGVKAAQRAIRRGIELGMVHLDTAEMYGAGRVEQLLGEAIRGIPRERLFIVTKVLPSNASYRGTIAAADRSLERLGCEYVDLYLLHWPGSHPLAATMEALEALVEQGKTRFIGVSNFEPDEMIEAASHLRKAPLACNQVLYHLCERGIEHALIPAAGREGIAVVAYTPFGRGSFLRSEAGRRACESVAKKHGATERQVALAFLTREPGLFAIPKAARVEHVEENAAAGALELDAADVAKIDDAYPRGGPRALATL